MSNPCINRWGLNSFWHHYWYSDSRYALNVHQDKIFITLLQTFLLYGLRAPTNWFWNKHWYKTSVSSATELPLKDYYRWITIYHENIKSIETYRLRLKSDEHFQTRINVLKFDSTVVVNVYWFQPDKKLKKRLKRMPPTSRTQSVLARNASASGLKKLRTLTNRLTSPTFLTNNYQF